MCEGYTDVIGFARAGVARAVAACGTALTEDHVRLLKRFARRIVLAFDADAAGQSAAERFYEWEKTLRASRCASPPCPPAPTRPTSPAATPTRCATAVRRRPAVPRASGSSGCWRRPSSTRPRAGPGPPRPPLAIIAEHPSDHRAATSTPGRWPMRCGLPVDDIVRAGRAAACASPGSRVPAAGARPGASDTAEVVALRLLVHRFDGHGAVPRPRSCSPSPTPSAPSAPWPPPSSADPTRR